MELEQSRGQLGKRPFRVGALGAWALSVAIVACSSANSGKPGADADGVSATGGTGSSSEDQGSGGLSASGGGSYDEYDDDLSVSPPGGGNSDGGTVCEETSAETELAPLYLAFAFDVSGSMGALDRPYWWHDPERKWRPVVEATKAFFEEPSLERMNASMVLFPVEGGGGRRCDSATYETPDVPMTELPSMAFGEVLSAYEEEVGAGLAGGRWRGGTPTFAVLEGAGRFLAELETDEDGARAVVLVTDGLPQGCDEELEEVAQAARELSERGIPTYVIGIENPTVPPAELPAGWANWGNCSGGGGDEPCPPPETLAALNQIAEAGGTGSAFLIDTSNPTSTKGALLEAIEDIRKSSFPCTLAIPPHPQGLTFAPEEIDVSVGQGGTIERLDYDEACSSDRSWRYTSADDERAIELCPEACASILSSAGAELQVNFLCAPRPIK